jgi:importin-7
MEKGEIQWSNEEVLGNHFRAVAAALNDPELPVQVQAALALTAIIDNHEKVRETVAPQIGKVIQDLLRLSEETDLDLLNLAMDKMVEHFQDDLIPVAAQLTAKLVIGYFV